MTLRDTIHDILPDYPDGPLYEELTEKEQRALVAAYIEHNPSVVADMLAEIPNWHIGRQMAQIALTGDCDAIILAQTVAEAVFPVTPDIQSCIQGELDHYYRVSLRYPKQVDEDIYA